MKATEIFLALTVYLIIPLLGLIYFLFTTKKIRNQNIPNPPTKALFLVFTTYAGLLELALWVFLEWWGGLASLTAFYLILVAPIAMGIIAYRHRQTKAVSKYHNWTYLAGLSYFVIAPVTILALYLVSKN